jgi:hypothetical protein
MLAIQVPQNSHCTITPVRSNEPANADAHHQPRRFGFTDTDGELGNGKSSEEKVFAPSHRDMSKRGGREGPNVTNPTLTRDRPTKLFAFLRATTTLKQMLEYRSHNGGTAHNCSLSQTL